MRITLSMIEGANFVQAGTATSNLKKLLKKINIHPTDMRRAIIAAFEAEMNVVIHAHRGSMRALVNSNEIEIEVRDAGPGISDIELAMQEGFSTASPAARELGYGAGMGLPNIKKNSDLFEISSTVGEGTRLTYTVRFKQHENTVSAANSLQVAPEKCFNCLFCIRVCPTKALRVHQGQPEIIPDLCIDCTACIEVCKSKALSIKPVADESLDAHENVLIVPSSFLAQFTARINPRRVLAALKGLGFGEVFVTEAWDLALREAVVRHTAQPAVRKPVISPVCPAVINLIRLQFQTLMDHVAPFLPPLEAVQKQFEGRPAVFLVHCPGQLTTLTQRLASPKSIVTLPALLRKIVQPQAAEHEPETAADAFSPRAPAQKGAVEGILEVSGIRHVIKVLEKVENGRLPDVRLLELYACDCGCFGSPLYTEAPFVARYRWRLTRGAQEIAANVYRRETPLQPRAGMGLDRSISRAIVKFSEIEEIVRCLPGKDCGLCGAPTCATLAEDVVIGKTRIEACPYYRGRTEEPE